MNGILNKYLHVFFLLALPTVFSSFSATGQEKFTAVPSENTLGQNEVLQLQYIIEGAETYDHFTSPSFRDFDVLQGPASGKGWSLVNNNLTEYLTVTYYLRPNKTGKLNIPPATVIINGKKFTSNSLVITVTRGSQPSPFSLFDDNNTKPKDEMQSEMYLKENESPQEKISKNLFVKLDLSSTECYEGQPVIATYKLYTRLESESKVVKRPSFNGFSVVDMDDPSVAQLTKEKLHGKMFNCYLIRKSQLFPLQNGDLEIEPIEVSNTVRFYKRANYNNSGAGLLEDFLKDLKPAPESEAPLEEKITLHTDPVKIRVKPLPTEGRPTSFNGAVGDFKISSSLQKNKIASNETGTLEIKIEGKGNLHLINTPHINWPKDTEPFEPKVSEETNSKTTPISGKKIFEIPFSVKNADSVVIPPVQWSFFDVQNKHYKELSTAPLILSITPDETDTGDKNTLISSENEKASVKEEERLKKLMIITGLGLLFLVMITYFIVSRGRNRAKVRKQNEKLSGPKEADEWDELLVDTPPEIVTFERDPLHWARERIDGENQVEYYTELKKSLWSVVQKKFRLREDQLNKNEIMKHLAQYDDEMLMSQFAQVSEACDLALYASVSPLERRQSFRMAENIIDKLKNSNS